MSRKPDTMIREMVDTIVREADPDKVILFGSHARGNARSDSDVDLLIIESEPFGPSRSRRKETARLYLALRQMPIAKDLLLYSKDEYERFKNMRHHVIGQAQREGKVLHARS